MASDPELPRFAVSSCHWPKGGQSRIDRPGKADCNSAPWQHLPEEVLHFVCELRGPITTGSRFAKTGAPTRFNKRGRWLWVPAFAGTTAEYAALSRKPTS